MSIHVALLRGINVGGNNLLPMKALAKLFETNGCVSVRTYIQSGNVIFDTARSAIPKLGRQLESAIEQQFGFRSPLIFRSAEQMREVVVNSPHVEKAWSVEALHVAFMASQPDPALVGALDPNYSPPDSFVVRGNEIYLHLPNGAGRSKLNAYLDSRMKTKATARNWRTVNRLLEMMEG